MQRRSLLLRRRKPVSLLPSAFVSSPYHAMMFQNPGYEHGDTQLHLAIRRCNQTGWINVNVVDDLIRDVGQGVVAAMSVITNDDGKTPVDLLDDLIIEVDEFDKLHQQLIDLMKTYPVRTLSEPLNKTEVTESTESQANRKLNANLKLAVNLVNQVRQSIRQSATHPSWNNFVPGEQTRVVELVSKSRRFMDNQPVSDDEITNISYYATRYASGNCSEFSYTVLDLLRKTNPTVSAEAVRIKYGDHVFVVIDRQSGSDIANSATWGESCVVCDAWSGDVYPAAQLTYKLMNFSALMLADDSSVNLLHTYNPRFHVLAVQGKVVGKKIHHSGLFKSDLQKKRTAEEGECSLPLSKRHLR